MSSGLPADDSVSRLLQDFGIGMYDSDVSNVRGDSDDLGSERNSNGISIPDGGGPESDPPELMIGYPILSSDLDDLDRVLAAISLPGDVERPSIRSKRPAEDVIDDRLPTVADSGLPDDHDNPAARTDYYDHMTTSTRKQSLETSPYWPDEDTSVYGQESLPKVPSNEVTMDNDLGALGNYLSGYEVEDISGPNGFPSEDFTQNVDYSRSNDGTSGGSLIASKLTRARMNRTATNISLVDDLTKEFLKDFGKKDLTRRHVMTFLQQKNSHQYLASDIVRNLMIRHNVYVKDVLDEFPEGELIQDGRKSMASVHDKLIEVSISNFRDPEVANTVRRSAASVSTAIALLERIGVFNGR
jgi:hypothetical protein